MGFWAVYEFQINGVTQHTMLQFILLHVKKKTIL